MKKKLFILTLAAALVLSSTGLPAGAYSDQEKNTADALYQMDLFEGYGDTYGLDNSLNRYEGYVLMIRMLGQEDAAKKCTAKVPFTDVDAEWAKNYVAYAYSTGLTKGVDATHFGGTNQMNTRQFATICLRSLGYDDGAKGDFSYNQAEKFAKSKGVETPTGTFDRGGCVEMLWSTLNASEKGGTKTLAQQLISKGVFTEKDFSDAQRIEREGISAGDKSGEKSAEAEHEILPPGGWGGGAATTHQHQWNSGVVTKAATCTAEGVRTYTCSGCGETVTQSIPAKGHVLVADAAVAATCTATGKTAGTHCSRCGAIITPQETVTMLPHDYQGGVCVHCGAKDPNAAVVCTHEHVSRQITKAASCEADGVFTYTCKDCHATWTEPIPATGHDPVADKAVAPTCTAAGKTAGSHCSHCGAVLLAQQTVPAKGHTVVEDLAVAATCTTEGKTEGSHCIVCDKVLDEQREIPKLGHSIVNDPAVSPTATKNGRTAGSHCSRCGEILVPQEIIPATGSLPDEGYELPQIRF